MHLLRPRKGQVLQFERPVWEPLIELVSERVDEFMWMHEVELEDGTRLSRKRIRFVIEHSFLILGEDPPPDRPGATARGLVFLGEDPQQVPLEVIAIKVKNGNLRVIHAMRMRPRYKGAYKEVRR